METLPTPTTPHASFWRRLNAYGCDFLLVQLAVLGPMLALYPFPPLEQIMLEAAAQGVSHSLNSWTQLFTISCVAASAPYNIAFTASRWQATLGKRLFGLKVVGPDGGKLTLPHSALRHATSGLSMLFMGLPGLSIAFTRERTAPHDLLCKTRVILHKGAPR